MLKTASSQAAWALLTEGVTKARVDVHRVQHLVSRAQTLVDQSKDRELLYQVAGDIIEALPKRLDQLALALDRTALALVKMGDDFLSPRLPISDKVMVEEAVAAVFGAPRGRQSAQRRIAALYLVRKWGGR